MKKHFVTFFCPGTFLAEQSEAEVETWDIDAAVKAAGKIRQRHGARPYAFQFRTMEGGGDNFEPTLVARSPLYWLGGQVRTFDEVMADNLPEERILRDNMRSNGWRWIITNTNSYRWTMPLDSEDVVLDVQLPEIPA